MAIQWLSWSKVNCEDLLVAYVEISTVKAVMNQMYHQGVFNCKKKDLLKKLYLKIMYNSQI